MKFKLLISLLVFSFVWACYQREERFIFFLHNRFLEEHGLSEAHPVYGRMEYLEIIKAFKDEGFKVISEKRKGNVNARDYAQKINQQIDSLLQLGIEPNKITVIGTSKGGYIAQYVSTFAKNPDLNFVFIACYMDGDVEQIPEINYCGNVLTIYEKTDTFGVTALERKLNSSCDIKHFKEIELNTGLQHGFLFKPMKLWIEPSVAWANGHYNNH
ncbi:MAG: alpha/beta hydrolase [Saprospiraceae bacterium]